jgi:hypothetical protein
VIGKKGNISAITSEERRTDDGKSLTVSRWRSISANQEEARLLLQQSSQCDGNREG